MTIDEFEKALNDFADDFIGYRASDDYISGARTMAVYAVEIASRNLINIDTSLFELDKLEDGKCYTVSIDLKEIKPVTARNFLAAMQKDVKGRNITLIPKLRQMEVEEVKQ